MDENTLSNDDDSMSSVSHIPTEKGINKSDTESMSINRNDNSDGDEEDQGRYNTDDGMDQEELFIGDNMKTNEDENERKWE